MAANSNHLWTNHPQMNIDFIDLCLNEIATSGYQGTSLKLSSWKSIRETLSSKYPVVFNTVGNQSKFVKNRWLALKKKFSAFLVYYNHTGNVYNETMGLFTFDDDQWDILKKQNLDYIQFKPKSLEYKGEMYGMFDGISVTFEHVASHTMMNKNIIDMTIDEVDGGTGFTQDTYFEGVGFTTTQIPSKPTTPLSPTNPGTIPSMSGTSNSSKRKRVEPTSDPAMRKIVGMMHAYSGAKIAGTAGSSAHEGDYSMASCMTIIDYSMASCMTIILQLQEEVPLERGTLKFAIKKMGKSLDYMKSFISLIGNTQRAFFLESLAM